MTQLLPPPERAEPSGMRRLAQTRGPLLGRLGTVVAAVLAIAAVLFDNRWLGVAALALAGTVLVATIWGLVCSAAQPLRPLAEPLLRVAARVARRLAEAETWIHERMVRGGARLAKAFQALDDRLGGPVASAARRVPARLTRVLLVVPRCNAWLALVIVTTAGLAGLVYVVSGWLGSALDGRTKPIAVEWLYLGAFVTAAVVWLVLAFWIRQLGRVVVRKRWRMSRCTLVALLAVAAGVAALSDRPVPGEGRGGREADKLEGGRGTDVLVVVDPADPAGRELAEYLRGDPTVTARKRTDARQVGFGLVVPVDPSLPAGSEAWTVLEPPTLNRRHFRDSVAAVAPREGGRATGDYAALLDRLRDPEYLEWHSEARRTVALVLSRLPQERALGPGWAEVVARYRADRKSERYVRPLVFTQERRPERIRRWRSWLEQMGGRLLTYGTAGPTLVADVEDAATGAPVSGVRDLAKRYSPYLRFDVSEQFFPVDVDDLLAKAGEQGGHAVCDHVQLLDDCRPLDDYRDLLGDLDEYIDFEGGARLGQDLVDRDVDLDVRRVIYVDAVEQGNLLHLAYWWFLRYNVSPWKSKRNCLPGFTFAETTCFDHEGDWEGVTVTLRAKGSADASEPYARDRWELDAVSYASHKHVIAWEPSQLELLQATHPVVYVAKGSHAAYPTRCLSQCTQKLAGSGLPEGEFGGQANWAQNDSACCLPLPVTPAHRGALWNAFPGKWGKAVCTAFVKICTQSDGPDSPSRQGRFGQPVGATFANRDAALAAHRKRYGQP